MPGQTSPLRPGLGQAEHLLYGTASWQGTGAKDEDALFRRLLPEAFTCGCLLIFVGPMVKSFHLAYDPLVIHWVGDWPKLAAASPLVLVALGYSLHRARGRLSKAGVLLSLLGSSVVLGLMAHRLAMASLELGDRFAASDCTTFPGKSALERDWKEASRFHAACRTSIQMESFVVQDCRGYEAERVQHPSWAFLKRLEETYGCAGFCTTERRLWTLGNAEDGCSSVTAFVMSAKIHPTANQVFVYSVAVLLLTSLVLFLLGPWLRERGYEW